MVAARVEVLKIDYEKCIRSLLERMLTKLPEEPEPDMMRRLLQKLGESTPDVLCFLMSYISDQGKAMLISELANKYQEKLTELANGLLSSNDIGKNIVFGEMEFQVSGAGLFIDVRDIKINYSGIIKNENAREKVEDVAQQYLDNSVLGKKLPGIGSALKRGAGSVARLAAALLPEEVEKRVLQMIGRSDNRLRLAALLEEMLVGEGLVMEIGEIAFRNVEADHTGESSGQKISVRTGSTAAGVLALGLSEETEDILLDALSNYLKESVYKR